MIHSGLKQCSMPNYESQTTPQPGHDTHRDEIDLKEVCFILVIPDKSRLKR